MQGPSVKDSITVTIATVVLLSIINLTDAKSLEEVWVNFWKRLAGKRSELAGVY